MDNQENNLPLSILVNEAYIDIDGEAHNTIIQHYKYHFSRSVKKFWYLSHFSMKTYVVGTH